MKRRMTTQKKCVYESLEALGHASTEELITYIQLQHKQISLATIYRNIHTLLAENKIKIVKLKGQDVLETVKQEHAHFVCERCGSILDVAVDKSKILDKNFKNCMHQIQHCDVALYGICQNCTREEKENEVRL